jgi:hypothetical protein
MIDNLCNFSASRSVITILIVFKTKNEGVGGLKMREIRCSEHYKVH